MVNMNKIILPGILALCFMGFTRCSEHVRASEKDASMETPANTSFYDLTIKSLDEKSTIRFADFKGTKVLCVNTASECGYTYQYEGLEALHNKYGEQVVVIGFPCNQFGGQEPGKPEEIAGFCQKNFGVSFLLTEKIDVKGENQHPVYQWLTQKSTNGVADYSIKWNFNKFLIDENGKLIGYFESGVEPMDEKITSLLQ